MDTSSVFRTSVHKHRSVTLERIDKFLSDIYFTEANVFGKIYPHRAPLDSIFYTSVIASSTSSRRSSLDDSRLDSPQSVLCRPPSHPSFETVLSEIEFSTPAIVGETKFGPSWSTHWVKLSFRIPEDWLSREVHLLWDSNCEALLFDPAQPGIPLQGLTGTTKHFQRHDFVLTKCATRQEIGVERVFYVEVACNCLFGCGVKTMIAPPVEDLTFCLAKAELAVFDRECYCCWLETKLLFEIAKRMEKLNAVRADQALHTANAIVNCFDVDDIETSVPLCRKIAKSFLSQKNGASAHQILAIGHSHLDVGWLWPYRETRRKMIRTFASQNRLFDLYPLHRFVQSQSVLWEWVKEDMPEFFEVLKRRVEEGRLFPVGGTFVEFDGNLPWGEAMVRQFVFGQKFFREEFGLTCDVFWLPDTFGFSCQIPQMMRKAGMRYFLTQKLSWNLINSFPHSSFMWEGLDGTTVLAHFPPADTYSCHLTIEEILRNIDHFRDRGRSNVSFMLYGEGDGAGGPKREHVETLAMLRNVDGLPKISPGTPTEFFSRLEKEQDLEDERGYVIPDDSESIGVGDDIGVNFDEEEDEEEDVDALMKRLLLGGGELPGVRRSEETQVGRSKILRWIGELYFELHRGVYTSQARVKRGNRRSEVLLREAEFYRSVFGLAAVGVRALLSQADDDDSPPTMAYPREILVHLWKLLLLNQFHDVLPGTSIQLVYHDALQHYAEIALTVKRDLLSSFFDVVTREDDECVSCTNSLSWDRRDVVELVAWDDEDYYFVDDCGPDYGFLKDVQPKDDEEQEGEEGEEEQEEQEKESWVRSSVPDPSPCRIDDGSTQKASSGRSLAILSCPAMGFSCAKLSDVIGSPKEEFVPVSVSFSDVLSEVLLENEWVVIRISQDEGTISLFDKRLRADLVTDGNRFLLFDDVALYWDAWDAMVFHLEKKKLLHRGVKKCTVLERGPLRAVVELHIQLTPRSRIVQRISLNCLSPRVDFFTKVSWHESHKFLKVCFPTSIRTDYATYEVQWGHLRRTNLRNTTWDVANFEASHQRWFDLSQYGQGLAIFNDCKYGAAILKQDIMTLSLLRAPKNPDPECDMGIHTFKYALFPHLKSIQDSGVIRRACEFNVPMTVHVEKSIFPQGEGVGDICEHSFVSVSSEAVIVESVKMAEDRGSCLVLRLYEAFGSSCQVNVRVSLKRFPVRDCTGLKIMRVRLCNLLEEIESQAIGVTGLGTHTVDVPLVFETFEIMSVLVELAE